MNRTTRLKTRLLTGGLLLATTPLAFAAGTDANTLIQNVAEVNYTINGNAQQQQQNDPTSAQFRVDRLVTFTVTADAAAVDVNPNQTGAVLSYTVTNNSNDVLDFSLAFVQNGSDGFQTLTPAIFVETDGTPGYSAGDTLTYIDELVPGDSKVVYIVGDIPISATNGQQDEFYLVATAAMGGTAASQGADLLEEATNDAMTVETVFGEGAGGGAAGDGTNDGKNSDNSAFNVAAASITVNKQFIVLDDPINGSTDPHPIPGAHILYCITVSNAPGGQAADNVVISDQIPTGTTFRESTDGGVIKTFATSETCAAGLVSSGGTVVPDGTGYDSGTDTVTTNNGTVAAGGGTTTIFQVTITP